MWKSPRHLILATTLLVAAAAARSFANEAELIAVLRSQATLEQKSAACRQLARVGTKQAVPALAELLGDEKLSHMARYALEVIPDASVNDALRDALGKVEGRPRLGVIGSLGVRRDAQAVDALAALLKPVEQAAGSRFDTAAAAARALGIIGTPSAAKALLEAIPAASDGNRLALCEGLLRCAEALAAGEKELSQSIYDRLRGLADAPHQVRTAALRGAVLARGKDGVALLVEAIRSPDYVLASAAARTAMEMPGVPEITDALVTELPKTPAERQGLLILALADRHEARVLPAVLQAAQSGDPQLRLVAFRALKRVGDASCVPSLLDAATKGSDEVSQAALESLESLQGKAVDDQLTAQLSEARGKLRLVLIDLIGRRRTAGAASALWQAADDADPAVRAAALASLGTVMPAADLPKLIARLAAAKDDSEAAAVDKAIREVCLRAEDREAAAAQLAASLATVDVAAKAKILETLNLVGGTNALNAIAAAARSGDEKLRDEAFRVLGQWKSANAAPILLELHGAATDPRLKIRAVRAYVRIARQLDMPADRRAEMCRTALKIAERDEDKRLVLEVLLRYPTEEMAAIAVEAAKVPALKEEASLVVMGMASKGINRAELGRALAQAGHKPVKVEIVKAEYGAGEKTADVTAVLRKHTKNYRIIFLPSASFNEGFGGDPAPGVVKQLKIQYRIDGKEGNVALNENATIVLPIPK